MNRPKFATIGDFEDYCELVERERDWWKSRARKELSMTYMSENRVNQEMKKLEKAMEKETA